MNIRVQFIVLTALLSCLYLTSGLHRPIDSYDEGVILTGAMEVARGNIPYLNFWTTYAPGQFLIVGALFKILGESLLVFRLYDLAIKLLLVTLLSWLALGNNRKSAAILTALVATLWMERLGLTGYTIFPALCSMLITILLIENRNFKLAGLALAVTAFFRHDFAAYHGLTFLILALKDRRLLKPLGFALLAVIPLMAVFILKTDIQALYDQLLYFPLVVFPTQMSLSALTFFGNSPSNILLGIFPFFCLIICFNDANGNAVPSWKTLWLSALILLLQFRIRSDIAHLLPTLLLVIPLFFRIYTASLGKRDLRSILVNASGALFILILVGIPLQSKLQLINHSDVESSLRAVNSTVAAEYQQVERILPICQNSLFILPRAGFLKTRSDLASYFIWKIMPPTKYYEPHPGMIDNSQLAAKILAELRERKTQCILWTDPYAEATPQHQRDFTELESALKGSVTETLYTGNFLWLEKL